MNNEEQEISLLDLLLVVAENIRLLIVGPVLVGLFTWGIFFFLPQRYTSQAILALPASMQTQAAAMMESPLMLGMVAEALQLSNGRNQPQLQAGLAEQVQATVGKDGLLRLSVTAQTPQQAQTISGSLIDLWLKGTVPDAQARAGLEKRQSYVQTSLDAVTRVIARRLDAEASLSKVQIQGELGTSLRTLRELQARYLGEVLSITRELQDLSRTVVKQVPVRPAESLMQERAIPAEQVRIDLEKQLVYAKKSLDAVTSVIALLDTEGTARSGKPQARGDFGASLLALGVLQSHYLTEVLSVSSELQGLSRDVIKQPPTLPTQPATQQRSRTTVLAVLASVFLLLLWVFMRQAWRNSTQDPELARKQYRIKAALGLK